MSQIGLTMTSDTDPPPPSKNRRASKILGIIVLLVIIAVIAAGGVFAYRTFFKTAPDYVGDGHGSVIVTIKSGESIPAIANDLAAKDVVKSADAFVDVASSDPKAQKIQAGVFEMRLQMSAASALNLLANPTNKTGLVTIPEGTRATRVVEIASAATKTPVDDYKKVIANPKNIGLPSWANNKVEGFLYPTTYNFAPGTSAESQLKAMVDKFKEHAAEINLETRAQQMGKTPYEVLTVASIVQAEGLEADFPKIATVIYNRLACTLPACQTDYLQGKLEMDSTVNYGQGTSNLHLTQKELQNLDNPYNTYKYKGLPPTPINNPGAEAIEAALNPEPGNWLYFVSVPGFTAFADNFKQQQQNEAQWRASQGDASPSSGG